MLIIHLIYTIIYFIIGNTALLTPYIFLQEVTISRVRHNYILLVRHHRWNYMLCGKTEGLNVLF